MPIVRQSVGGRRYGAGMMVVARQLPVCGLVNAGKAAVLGELGKELDRVRVAVWAQFSDVKTAHLSKRQIRDRLMAEDAPAGFGVPQRLWRATVEDTVDKIRAFQQAVIATEVHPRSTAEQSRTRTNANGCCGWPRAVAGGRTHGCRATSASPLQLRRRGRGPRGASSPTTAPTTLHVTGKGEYGWRS